MLTRREFLNHGALTLLAVQVSELSEGQAGTGLLGTRGREKTVRQAIGGRRTARSFSNTPLSRQQLMDLLWAGQGITDPSRGLRSAPSAGALYPMELYAAIGRSSVTGLEEGIYRYSPRGDFLEREGGEDLRRDLATASLSQMWMAEAPVSLVICGIYGRTTRKYRDRGFRYVHMEAGCVAENVFLMAGSLGLSAGIVGAFVDEEVAAVMDLPKTVSPLLIMPVGYSK